MEELRKEFEEKFIQLYENETWDWKNVHYLDMIKFIEKKLEQEREKTVDFIFEEYRKDGYLWVKGKYIRELNEI